MKTITDKYELLAQRLKEQGIVPENNRIKKSEYNNEPFNLSFEQQRIWFLQQFTPNSPTYNDPTALRIKGTLQKDILEKALKEIVERHETLRTVFKELDGKPVQMVLEKSDFGLEEIILSGMMEGDREAAIQQMINKLASRPFNMAGEPLIRCYLLFVTPDDHVLVINMHHIISDGWSKGLLAQELMSFYSCLFKGLEVTLPELKIQYRDYVRWQEEFAKKQEFQNELTFWKTMLKDAAPVLELPLDFPRPTIQTSRGTLIPFEITPDVYDNLKMLARNEGVSLFMLMLALFKILLFKYTGQKDIIIGTPVAGRRFTEIENLIGVFINTLALRDVIEPEQSFTGFLNSVKNQALLAFENQNIPFDKLVEVLNPVRDMSHSPVFQVLFTMQNMPVPRLSMEDLNINLMTIDSGFSQFDLSMTLWEDNNRLLGTLEYNTDLFLPDRMHRAIRHFQHLIHTVLAESTQRLCEISLLSSDEKMLLTKQWNKTREKARKENILHHIFERQVDEFPERIALFSGETTLTYKELNHKANQVAHFLLKQGIKKEDIVAVCIENSIDFIISILAVLKSGAAYLPVDPMYPPLRIKEILADSSAVFIITHLSYPENFKEMNITSMCIQNILAANAGEKTDNPAVELAANNLLAIIYTSGTTGKPKGIMLEHRNISNLVYSFIKSYHADSRDVLLPITSIGSASFIGEIFPALCCGAALVLSDHLSLLDYEYLLEMISRYKVTIISTVPSMLARLNHEKTVLSSLRLVLSGGETLSPGDIDNLIKHTTLVNGYGITETSVCSTYYILEPSEIEKKKIGIPIGKPVRNTRIYILDKYQQPVPVGVHGEIYIAGEGVTRGYLGDPDMTAGKYVNVSGLDEKELLFRSGDSGYWNEDGLLYYVGRMDKQVQIRGFRIETEEIEFHLSQHPAIKESIVVIREDDPGEKYLAAYIVYKENNEMDPGLIKQWLGNNIPNYMIPAVFVLLSELPLNTNGKVDKTALPPPDKNRSNSGMNYIAPQTIEQKKIANIWQDFLKIENIGIHDNFFDLGGHSLLIIQVHNRLRQTFEKTVTVVDLFKYPTIDSLARFFTQENNSTMETQKIVNRAQLRRRMSELQRKTNKDRSRPQVTHD